MRCLAATCVLVSLACFASGDFDLQASFDLVDANKDGYVSKAEFDGLYKTFDEDGDGNINTTEFISQFNKTGMSVQGSLYIFFRIDLNANLTVSKSEVDALFAAFDTNGDQSVNFQEYASIMNAVLEQLERASKIKPALVALFNTADADHSGSLSIAETPDLLAGVDQNGDNVTNKTEFSTSWHTLTNDSVRNGEAVFAVFDSDDDGYFGNQTDQKNVFDGFDYNDDQMVTEEEFLNSMLYVYARAMNIVDQQLVAEFTNPSTFDVKKIFDEANTNDDDVLSKAEVMASFNATDNNTDGIVSGEEFIASRINLGFSQGQALYMFFALDTNENLKGEPAEFRMRFHQLDRNGDQKVSEEEFTHFLQDIGYVMKEFANAAPKILALLDLADLNGDELLTREEMASIFAPADTNMDGAVDSKEYLTFWTQHTGMSEEISTRIFEIVDGNQNDKIDNHEQTALFNGFNNKGGDFVSFEEFRNSMLFLYAKAVREFGRDIAGRLQKHFNMTAAFDKFNLNNDHFLSMEESSFVNQSDTNGDGKVSPEEFINATAPLRFDRRGSLYLFFRDDSNNDQFVDQQEVDDSFASADVDDDNKISWEEYRTVWTRILKELQDASIAGYRLSVTFNYTDYDHSGNLTADEFKGLFLYADTNKDGSLAKNEFVSLWMNISGEPSNRAFFIFDILDQDGDGYFGNDKELTTFFDKVDYEDDDVITKDEFLNASLNLYARAVREEIKEENAKKNPAGVIGFF